MRKFMLITNRYKDRDLTLSNEIVSYIQQKGGSAAICVSNVEDDNCKKNKVDIAALTLPKEKAEDTAQHLVNLGIRAIWNFAHVDLDLSDKSVVVENVHLSDSLMQLSYNIVKNSK